MAYCRKVPVKRLKVKICEDLSKKRAYEDLSKYSWSIFKKLSSNADRFDIVVDVYLETRIKQQERNGRGRKCPIVETKINNIR